MEGIWVHPGEHGLCFHQRGISSSCCGPGTPALSIARDPSRLEGKRLRAHLHPAASRGVCGALANN